MPAVWFLASFSWLQLAVSDEGTPACSAREALTPPASFRPSTLGSCSEESPPLPLQGQMKNITIKNQNLQSFKSSLSIKQALDREYLIMSCKALFYRRSLEMTHITHPLCHLTFPNLGHIKAFTIVHDHVTLFCFMCKSCLFIFLFFSEAEYFHANNMDCDIHLQMPEHLTFADPGHFCAPLHLCHQPALKHLSMFQLSKHQTAQTCGWSTTCHLAELPLPGSPGSTKLPSQLPTWERTMGRQD